MDYNKPFVFNFDLKDGMSKDYKISERRAINLKGMFHDEAALEKLLPENPLIYAFYELDFIPEVDPGDLRYGTSIVYPGKVGDEYYMTKGHFHTILDTCEVYYCLSGHGYMMLETPEGDTAAMELNPGDAVYCPKRWAHRSVNVGSEKLVTYYVFRADAGHDYATIETKGFRKLLVEKDGKPTVIDNPNWNK